MAARKGMEAGSTLVPGEKKVLRKYDQLPRITELLSGVKFWVKFEIWA